jgi:hypothetical protein
MDIKPIETVYKGYRFRSRLEARWAVFFDALGLEWEYEKEGYDLGNAGWYLPDFWLPQQDCWIEIKPKFSGWPDHDTEIKAISLSSQTHRPLIVLCGTPGPVELYDDLSPYEGYFYFGEGGDYPYIWCECPSCGALGLQFDGRSARNKHKENCEVPLTQSDKNYNYDSQRILTAYDAARSARFEHGEIPWMPTNSIRPSTF